MNPPNPDTLYPIPGIKNTILLKPLLASHPEITNVSIGDFSYYSDQTDPVNFFQRNVAYNFGMSGARLEMGKFCAIAHGVQFIMADANHSMDGPSTFPFPVFGGDWAEVMPLGDMPFPNKGDIILGNDVWIGHESVILPGVKIGNGAIIGARSIVAKDVPDYTVVAGNPARIVRRRYNEEEVALMNRLAWWDWPLDKTTRALPLLVKGSPKKLQEFHDSE